MPQPTFFKELPWIVQIQGKPELVGFSVGVSKAVDPDSGMTLNLALIIDWQNQWSKKTKDLSFESWFQFLESSRMFFEPQAKSKGAELRALQIRFEAGALLRQDSLGFRWTWQQVLVDSLQVLRRLKAETYLQNDSDFERVRKFQWPSPFPGAFSETELILNLFESSTGLALQKLEIWDPLGEIAQVL